MYVCLAWHRIHVSFKLYFIDLQKYRNDHFNIYFKHYFVLIILCSLFDLIFDLQLANAIVAITDRTLCE